MRNNKSTTNKKRPFKGPFPNNSNLEFDQIRKNMTMSVEGPTADAMSYSDSTTDIFDQNNSQKSVVKKRPKKKITKIKSWWEQYSKEIVNGFIITFFTAIGIIVYKYSNHFVANDKDIEYLQKNDLKQDNKIEELNKQTNSLDKKSDLIKQQIDLENK